jgi:hypothetical protein
MRGPLLLPLFLLLLAPPLRAAETVYGAGVRLDETVKISALLAQPEAYLGKRVRVEGTITEVCGMKGCWMELAEGSEAKIRVKVEDDVIAFPVSARGKIGIAEGVLEAIPMTREKYVEWQRHLAEERGQTFDAAAVGDGPFQVLQVRGAGAKILDP